MHTRFTANKFLLTLMLLALAGVTACADYPKRSAGDTLDDQTLEYAVSNAINQDPAFSQKNDHIKVEVNNGVVLLAGETISAANKVQATKIAEQQKMTIRVVNDLQVMERGWLGEKSNNSWLTAKVNSVLLAKNPLPGNDASRIKVVSSRGTVYLMGMVSQKEADEVVEIVRNVRGVDKVVKIFDYTDKS